MVDRFFDVEARSKLALEAAQIGVWSFEVMSGTVKLDGRAASTWGLPAGAQVALSALDELVHPDDRVAKQAALDAALDPNGSGSYQAEYRVHPRGEPGERHIISYGKTEFADGKPARIFGIMRDVTERRQIEDALRQSAARLSGILSIAADAIISIDERQRITMFNNGAESIFGYTTGEVIGQPLEMLMPECFRASHANHVRQFGSSGTIARRMGERREIFGLRKDGQEFPAEASISSLEMGGERIFTVLLRDITTRKQVEKRLEQVNLELESRVAERTRALQEETERRLVAQAALARAQRMEAFGQLAGGIAHDFNNLLTVISGNQELLEMRLDDAKALVLLKRSQEAAEMAARLTARLLTFARRRQLEPVLLNLNEQITGMVELLRRSIGEHVTLTTKLPPQLGLVRADPSEIENAVLNLAINARDAMPNGGMLVIETADCQIEGGDGKLPAGDYVRISVSDTGNGMTPEVLARAFEPFFTTKPPGQGTGLGLSTIYGFVQQSGGAATVYSEAGHGTTINMLLPRIAEVGAAASPIRADAAPPVGKGETILLVEDRPDVREVTRQRLQHLGYQVLEADNGVSAIKLLEGGGRSVHLVFSDVVMPGGVSGFDVARWVNGHRPGLKVLLNSGFSAEVVGAREGELPAVRLLRKPYTLTDLAGALREVLDG